MSRPRVTTDDLRLAREWLREYNDGQDTDPQGAPDEAARTMFRVADWLDAEIGRRNQEAAIREVTKDVEKRTGKRPSRAAILRVLVHHRETRP